MIYIIIGIFISLLFVLFCCLNNIANNICNKTKGKLEAVNCKIYNFKEVLKKYNITIPSNIIEKTKEYNKLTDIEKKAVLAASNGIFKQTLIKEKLENKYGKFFKLSRTDFYLLQFIIGLAGFFTLVISLIAFATITVEMKECEDKIKVYSDMENNVRPYEEDVVELIYKVKHGKELAKNHYWTSLRTKRWLELDETPLNTIKNTKGFNTIPPRTIERK